MKKYDLGFAVAGSAMTICFLALVNFITSPHDLWFIYPTFGLLFWPIGLFCSKNKKYTLLSLLYSIFIISFLVIENVIETPHYPWSLYAVFPFILWPILMFLGRHVTSLAIAWIGFISIVIYYASLNIFLSPHYPWVIYPAFVALWWPLSLHHARKKTYFAYSLQASLCIILFFIIVNIVSSPQTIWAVYPIFCVLWWPLTMYYYVYKRKVVK